MDPDFDFNFTEPSLPVHKTLLSLNSNLPDSKFSMRDALSALPVDPDEHPPEPCQTPKQRIQDATNFPTTLLTIELKAPTSPATRIDEDSLTYLNQGQSYDLRLSESFGEERMLIKSIVRICFHEEKMQFMENKHLELWQSAHPGERLLDIEADKCIGCRDAFSDPVNLNAVVCIWDSSDQCTLVVKAFCVSTEFTAKKHGGEKGVPFRIQVDSFREADHTHIYSAACQVKVFKTKGAERKNRTDKEKIDRKPAADRLNYKPSTPSTFLEEISYFPPFSRLMIDDSSSCCPLIDSLTESDLQLATPCFASPSQTDERSSSPKFSTAFGNFSFAYHSSNLSQHPPPFNSSPPPPSSSLTLAQQLEDGVADALCSVPPSENTRAATTASTNTPSPSVLLYKRSPQDHLDMGLGEIGLAASRQLRPHTDLRQRQARGTRSPPGGGLQPPVKNGRRLGSPTRGSRPEFSRVPTEPTITSSSFTTWPDQPAAPAPDNVDLLPFSQCEISGNRHYQQASKTIPLSVHSSSASSETCFFPSADVPVAEPPPPLALPSFPLFKQPALRRLPVPVDAHTSTVIASPQRVHGKKRGVGSSAAAACFVSSPPCPGICAACGRACPGSMTEFGVKRQRRRRQTGHRLLKGYSFPKLPSLTSACPSESPNSLPGLKQQEIAVPRPCLLAQPSCSQNVQTSDYSSHSQQTGDEEVRGSCPNDPVIPSNSLSDLDSGRQVESQGCNGDGEDDGEEEDDDEEEGIRDGDEEEEDDDDDDDDDDEEEEEENVAEGDDEDEDYDGEVAPAPCQRFAQNVAVGCTISEPSQVQASVTVSSSVQTSVPKSENLTLAVASPPSTATVSRCQVIPRSLDTPVPCSESAIRSGGGSSGFRKARPFKPDMNRAAVANWLRSSGFGNLRSKFGRFSGADMLRLNRRDFIQICGTQEGIRLSNAILQKPPRATCTVYVRRNNDSVFNALYLYHQTEDELRSRLSTFLRPSAPLGPLVLQNSEDIPVIITDEVVSHFEDQGCFTITLEQPTEKEGAKAVLRKH